jgi:hypothetical protein
MLNKTLNNSPIRLFLNIKDFTSKNSTIINKFERYFLKKMSVENFLQKLLEIDKILYVLFNKQELLLFKTLRNSNHLGENNQINIQNLFNSFEFFDYENIENNNNVFEALTDQNPTFFVKKMVLLNQKIRK